MASLSTLDQLRTPLPALATEAPVSAAAPLVSADQVQREALHAWDHTNPNGSPTHYPTLDKHWLWQPGETTAVTGWPGMGKSLAELNKMVTKAVYDEWKFALFVPENMPLRKAVGILVQAYVGQSVNPDHPFRMSRAQYEDAVKWVTGHFTFIDPRQAHSLKTLLPAVKAAKRFGIKGWLLDPFNDLESKLGDFSGMMSEQLRAQLSLILDFTKDEQLCTLICVHPAGEARNAKTMELKIPDQYSMEGGRMWPNRMDSICVWHRPMADEDPTDSSVDFYVKKMRNEPESGFKTPKLGVRLHYERRAFRYIDPLLGMSPLDPKLVQRYRQTGSNQPPEGPRIITPALDLIAAPGFGPLPASKFNEPAPF
ncbi:hypothetical protein [Hymenobacter koreensis]|uniref:SF4 helicase domain-containing protein n=1 Tax=Hymenobacter koreensis TaxID=1084523 RepID=A0ABP8JP27_9BACT